jgi:hypothetical protein
MEVFKDFSPDGISIVPAMNEVLGDVNITNNTCSCATGELATSGAGVPEFIGPPVGGGSPASEVTVKSDRGDAFLVFNPKSGDYKFVRCDGIAFSGTGQIKNDGCFTMLEDNRENFTVFVAVNVCSSSGKTNVNVFKRFSLSDGSVIPEMNVSYGDSNLTDSTATCDKR